MNLSQNQFDLIAGHQPEILFEDNLMQAAIAIILRDGREGTEFLLMQRARHKNDPWSGQMAFPGGKVEPKDVSKKATAIRETHEEVGIRLTEQEFIGQLDDLYGMNAKNRNNVHVACFVFKLDGPVRLKSNHEVEDLVWLPMAYLSDNQHAIDFYHPKDKAIKMPAVLIDQDKEQILWGMSLRMLQTLYKLIDEPMFIQVA